MSLWRKEPKREYRQDNRYQEQQERKPEKRDLLGVDVLGLHVTLWGRDKRKR